MPRKQNGSRGSGKAIIRVFCEGETEQAYIEFLKKQFADVAVIKYPKETGLFEEAKRRFEKDPQYRDYASEIDEVWFFFDVETKDVVLWEQRMEIIRKLRKLRRKPETKVRLLMTTGCIEYWLMLHFKKYAPPLRTVPEKERVMKELTEREPSYKKGDCPSVAKIAAGFQGAVENAKWTMNNLVSAGLPDLDDSDERNRWLCKNCFTFSNVFEAIEFLLSARRQK